MPEASSEVWLKGEAVSVRSLDIREEALWWVACSEQVSRSFRRGTSFSKAIGPCDFTSAY